MPLVPTVSGPLTGMIRDLASLDPDGASELMRIALYETLADDVERYGDGIRERVGKLLYHRQNSARRALVRSYVEKRERGEDVSEELKAAEYLAITDSAVAKAWDKRKHPRNAAGRFVHTLSGQGGPKDMQGEALDALLKMKSDRFLHNNSEVTLHGHALDSQGQFGGSFGHAKVTTDGNLHRQIAGSGIAPTHIAIDPKQTTIPPGKNANTVFDLTSRLAGEKRGTQAANSAPVESPQQLGSALDTVMRETQGTDRRAYRRMAATGQAIQRFSTPGSGAHLAGQVTQAVGQFGPEAEKVLGRPIARTAYRYRGTERKPNKMLVDEVDDATASADDIALAASNPNARRQLAQVARGGGLALGTGAYYGGARGLEERDRDGRHKVDHSTDQLDLRLRGDTAVGYFMRKLPTPEQYELSIEAGKVPPSQGTIIDARGQVYTEAVGYGEDHYLPFDLKNLRALNGGQYVRTRAAGGPTTEDVYTGLLTGARQLQVVSNSGVFTVEFDPDLRGGRRYSDKARQMVGRYEALLDRIQSNERSGNVLMANDIPDERKRELQAEAYATAGYNEGDAKQLYDDKLKRERLQSRFTGPTDKELEEAAGHRVDAELARQGGATASGTTKRKLVADTMKDLKENRRMEQARALRLDGEGYAAALSSLQQEFPYFIRSVDYETTAEFDANRRHTPQGFDHPAPGSGRGVGDRGYLSPGKINSAEQRGQRAGQSTGQESGQQAVTAGGGQAPGGQSSGQTRSRSSASGELANLGFAAPQGAKISDLKAQKDDLSRTAVDQLNGLGGLGYDFGENAPGDDEKADPAKAIGAKSFHMALHADPNQAKNRLNAAVGDKAQRGKLVQALQQWDAELDNKGNPDNFDSTGQAQRAAYPKEKLQGAISAVRRLDAADQPFAEQAEDPALYSPEGNDAPPQHFDEIDRLGTDQNNYEQFWNHVEANKAKAPFFNAGLEQLANLNPDQQRTRVRDEVHAFTNTVNWGGKGIENGQVPPKPGTTVTDNFGEARELAARPQTTQQYKRLLGMQQAWSFLHGLSIAQNVGGDAGPKAPSPSSPGAGSPQFSHQPPLEEQSKGVRRKVIVHSPDSPIAKALAANRRRSTWSRQGAPGQ